MAVALVVSLGLHALFWLFSPAPTPWRPPPDTEVTVEIITTPAPEVAPTPPETEPAPEAPPPRPRRRNPTPPPAAPAATPRDPEATLTMRPQDLGSDTAPVVPSGPLAPPTPAQLARAGITVDAPAVAPKPASKWARDMARRERAERGRANLRAGKAPPGAFELLREIERRFRPSGEIAAELARVEAGRARSTGRWMGRYLGGFLDHDPTEKDKPFEREAAFQRALKNATLEYDSRMCVVYNPAGEATVEVDGGAGIPGLDRLARDVVIQAADRRRPGFEGAVRACFRFSARLTRVPPLPLLMCGLDKNLRPECIYPLKELTATRVELDGVELGAQAEATPK